MAVLIALTPLLLLRLLLSGPALAPSVALTEGADPAALAVAADDGAIPHAAHLTGIDAAIAMASAGMRTATDAPGDVPPAEPDPGLCVAVPPVPGAEPAPGASPPRTPAACSSASPRAPPPHART